MVDLELDFFPDFPAILIKCWFAMEDLFYICKKSAGVLVHFSIHGFVLTGAFWREIVALFGTAVEMCHLPFIKISISGIIGEGYECIHRV